MSSAAPEPQSTRGLPRRPKFFAIGSIFYLALAIAGLLWIGTQRGRIALDLFFDPGTLWIDLLAGVALAALLLALWALMRRFLPSARALEDDLARVIGPLDRGEALALALISGLAEELFFRGALQTAIGWLPAAALFAVLHLGSGKGSRLWVLFAFGAGIAFGLLVAERERIAGAIVAHVLVNAVNLWRLSGRKVEPEPSEPAAAAED